MLREQFTGMQVEVLIIHHIIINIGEVIVFLHIIIIVITTMVLMVGIHMV